MTRREYEKKSEEYLNTIFLTNLDIERLQLDLYGLDMRIKWQDVRNKIDTDIRSYRANFITLENQKKVLEDKQKKEKKLERIRDSKRNTVNRLLNEKEKLSRNFILSFINRNRIKEIDKILSKEIREYNDAESNYENLVIINSNQTKDEDLEQVFNNLCDEYGIEKGDISFILKLDFKDLNRLLKERKILSDNISRLEGKVNLNKNKKEELDSYYSSINDDNATKRQKIDSILSHEFPSSDRLMRNPGSDLDKYQRKTELFGKTSLELDDIINSYSADREKQYLNEKDN